MFEFLKRMSIYHFPWTGLKFTKKNRGDLLDQKAAGSTDATEQGLSPVPWWVSMLPFGLETNG